MLTCLLPVHFQPRFNALQNHRLHAIHQRNKIFSNNSVVLRNTGVSCWHINYLWLGVKTWPTLLQLLDHVILDLFYFFLRNLVPFVAHEQGTLGWDWLFLSRKSHLPYFIQQLFKLQNNQKYHDLTCHDLTCSIENNASRYLQDVYNYNARVICCKKYCACTASLGIQILLTDFYVSRELLRIW